MAKKFVEHKTLNLTNVNNEVLDTWKEKDVFRKSVEEKEEYFLRVRITVLNI